MGVCGQWIRKTRGLRELRAVVRECGERVGRTLDSGAAGWNKGGFETPRRPLKNHA